MKLKVLFNRNSVLADYARRIIAQETWPWIKNDIAGKISKNLFKKSAPFFRRLEFSYKRHPLEDLTAWSGKFKDVLKEIEEIFNKEWKENYSEPQWINKIAKKIVKSNGDFIVRSIEETTRIEWKIKEIKIIPTICFGGEAFGNDVFIGRPRKRELEHNIAFLVQLLVHELIHINTNFLENRNKVYERLKFKGDSNEIATVILTNKVIDRLNTKPDFRISHQSWHSFYQASLDEHKQFFIEIGNCNDSYEKLICAVDDYLVKIKFHGYLPR